MTESKKCDKKGRGIFCVNQIKQRFVLLKSLLQVWSEWTSINNLEHCNMHGLTSYRKRRKCYDGNGREIGDAQISSDLYCGYKDGSEKNEEVICNQPLCNKHYLPFYRYYDDRNELYLYFQTYYKSLLETEIAIITQPKK